MATSFYLVSLAGPELTAPKMLEIPIPPTPNSGNCKWEVNIGRKEILEMFGQIPHLTHISRKEWKITVEMVDPPMLGWSGKVIGKDGTVIIQFGGDEYGWRGPWTVNHQIQGTYQDVEFTILFVKNNLDSIISPPFNWS